MKDSTGSKKVERHVFSNECVFWVMRVLLVLMNKLSPKKEAQGLYGNCSLQWGLGAKLGTSKKD